MCFGVFFAPMNTYSDLTLSSRVFCPISRTPSAGSVFSDTFTVLLFPALVRSPASGPALYSRAQFTLF